MCRIMCAGSFAGQCQVIGQPADLDQPDDRRTGPREHESSSGVDRPAVSIDQHAQPTRIDETDAREIDRHVGAATGERCEPIGQRRRGVGVDLAVEDDTTRRGRDLQAGRHLGVFAHVNRSLGAARRSPMLGAQPACDF